MGLNDDPQSDNGAQSNEAAQDLTPDPRLDVIAFSSTLAPNRGSMLHRAIRKWLQALPEEALRRLHAGVQELPISQKARIFPSGYAIYPPLLQLSSDLFSKWPSTIFEILINHANSLYGILCETFQITHIALSGPIPASLKESHNSLDHGSNSNPNILRSPANFHPVHGDFGPQLSPFHLPNHADFQQAFWCTANQNGITQTWAPRYTMFSRGNLSEKARILNLPTLQPERLGCATWKTSAVDLYAGIGYFALSYAKADVKNVLCWEINPWSIEALQRGVHRMGGYAGRMKVFREGEWPRGPAGLRQSRLTVFAESNEHASERLRGLRGFIWPVRHVNCGFLPSSQPSWETAVRALDPADGGWVHAHENIAKNDIESRQAEIVQEFERLVMQVHGPEHGRKVECEHLERVKSYSPHVIHCVLDIAIVPVKTPAS